MARTRLLVDIEANSAKLVTEMEKARKSTQGMASDLKLIKFDSIVNLGTRAIQTARQIYELGSSMASFGSDLVRNARTLGMTIEEYQQWTYVAKAADVEQQQLMLGIRVLTKNMGDLRGGTGEAKDALAAIGITAADSNKNIGELLPVIIKRLSEIGSTARQNQLSMEIFGSRSGLAIANMVREGKDIDEIVKRFKGLGFVTEDTAKKLADSEQAFKDMGHVWQVTKAEVLVPVVTVFAELLKAIIDIKKALLDNDWKALWGRMSPEGAGAPMKGGIGSMYLEYERNLKDKATSLYGGIGTGVVIPKGEEGEVRDVFGMTEADHVRSKNNLEWYSKSWMPDWIANLNSLSMGEGAAGEGLIAKWVQDDIKNAEEEYKKYVTEQLSDRNRYTKSIGEAEMAEKLYGTTSFISTKVEDSAKKTTSIFSDIVTDFSSNLRLSWNVNLVKMLADGESFGDSIKQVFKGIGDSLINTIQKMISNWALFGSVTGKKEEGGGLLKGGSWGGLIGTFTGLLGSKQHGTDYIPQTGPYLLHQGEAVVPAEKNKGGNGGTTMIFIEATDVQSFERKYGSVIDSRVIQGKRYNRMSGR